MGHVSLLKEIVLMLFILVFSSLSFASVDKNILKPNLDQKKAYCKELCKPFAVLEIRKDGSCKCKGAK